MGALLQERGTHSYGHQNPPCVPRLHWSAPRATGSFRSRPRVRRRKEGPVASERSSWEQAPSKAPNALRPIEDTPSPPFGAQARLGVCRGRWPSTARGGQPRPAAGASVTARPTPGRPPGSERASPPELGSHPVPPSGGRCRESSGRPRQAVGVPACGWPGGQACNREHPDAAYTSAFRKEPPKPGLRDRVCETEEAAGGKAAPSRTEGQPRFSRLPTLGCTDLNRLPFSLGTTPAARKWDRSANVRS